MVAKHLNATLNTQWCKGSQEGKRANLWGVRANFGANIRMKIGPQYQSLKELGQNSKIY